MFQDNKHLGKDALKFVKTFQVSVEHTDRVVIGTQEDWYTAGALLKDNGLTWSDYKTPKEALDVVRHICAKNKAEHGYDAKPEEIDDTYPELSKFWFVKSKGKTKTHLQDVAKKLEQCSDLKSLDQLEQAKLFMEGMGYQGEGVSSSNVKIESEKIVELKQTTELLKLSYLAWHTDRRCVVAVSFRKKNYIYIYMYTYTHIM